MEVLYGSTARSCDTIHAYQASSAAQSAVPHLDSVVSGVLILQRPLDAEPTIGVHNAPDRRSMLCERPVFLSIF